MMRKKPPPNSYQGGVTFASVFTDAHGDTEEQHPEMLVQIRHKPVKVGRVEPRACAGVKSPTVSVVRNPHQPMKRQPRTVEDAAGLRHDADGLAVLDNLAHGERLQERALRVVH